MAGIRFDPSELASSLRQWRKKTGRTQERAAVFLHVCVATYKGWEAAAHHPQPRQVRMLLRKKIIAVGTIRLLPVATE